MSTRTIPLFLFCAILLLFQALPLPLSAQPGELPVHRIAVSFDLAKSMLYSIVDGEVPKGVTAFLIPKGIRLSKVTIDGNPYPADTRDGRLPLPSHQGNIKVHLEYELSANGRDNDSISNTIGVNGCFLMGGWYPAAEAELSRFSLEVLVPEGLTALAEADRISEIEVDTGRLVSFEFPPPVPEIHLILGPYVVSQDRYKNVRLETYFFPEDKTLAHRYLVFSKKYLRLYEEMLGPYPFNRFAVAENIKPTGYGMPTFTLLGRQVLKLPFIPETSLGHEILHSWFGNSIYVGPRQGNWSEGLTTYLADHHYKQIKGEGWQYRRKC
ncbi:MAG: hypothetical protein JRH00_14895 [Deltaproteobacteria bacterium]|nr:hypothetical protein [Deltaproteobacteria bacterium]